MSALSAATNTAFELLSRCLNPKTHERDEPWSEQEGKKVRDAWRQRDNRPLQELRNYRNVLMHGRARMEFVTAGQVVGSDEIIRGMLFVAPGRTDANAD